MKSPTTNVNSVEFVRKLIFLKLREALRYCSLRSAMFRTTCDTTKIAREKLHATLVSGNAFHLYLYQFVATLLYLIPSILFTGSSATQEQITEDTTQSSAVTVDEEAELKELEFRARALESLVRARERQMKNEPA